MPVPLKTGRLGHHDEVSGPDSLRSHQSVLGDHARHIADNDRLRHGRGHLRVSTGNANAQIPARGVDLGKDLSDAVL